jgi:uncharacterized membrane protein
MRIGRFLFASLFIISGILHFTIPEPYLRIMPPVLPWPRTLVFVSGGAELLGGIALLVPRLRSAAGYGLALLLAGVFPANIYMAAAHVPSSGWLGNRGFNGCDCPCNCR